MARKPTPVAVAASRTILSACWTSACWILWALLLVVAGFLVTIHFKSEIPVPAFIIKRLEARFAEAQLQPRIGTTRFDPTGTLVLEDVRIHSPLFVEPLASARAIVLNLDLWAVFIGDFDVDEIDVIGLDLNCPAMFSPSGVNLPVVRDLHATFERESSTWRASRADFRIGRLTATLRGVLDPRAARRAEAPLDAKGWVRRYYEIARTIANNLHQLDTLGETRLDATFALLRNEPLRIQLEGDAERLTARGITITDVRIRADYDDGRTPGALVLDVSAPGILIEDRVQLDHPRVRVSGDLAIDPFKFTPGPLEFVVDRAEWEDKWVDTLLFRTSLAALPVLEGEIALSHAGTMLRALGSADPRDGSASATVEARFDAATLEEGLAMAVKRVRGRMIRALHFGGPVDVQADVQFANKWKFLGAQGRVRGLQTDILGVQSTAASATFDVNSRRLLATDLVLEAPDLHGTGSYEMDIATRDYRFLVKGRTLPETIAPWFTGWWPEFWSRFSFPADAPPEVDLEIAGRWRHRDRTLVAGSVRTGAMTVYELPFDEVSTRLFIRDRYFDVLEVAASVGDRRISGSLTLNERDLGDSTRRIHFNALSTLELPRYSRLAGPEILAGLKPFVFEDRAGVIVSGNVDFRSTGISEDITALVESTGTFRFFEFPVQDATFSVRSRDGVFDIRDAAAGLASGRLTGTAQSSPGAAAAGRTIRFNAKLADARVDELSTVLADFKKRAALPRAEESDTSESALAGRGILTMDLAAEGLAANPWGLIGKGTAQVTQAELGRIRVFGPLSKLFEGTIFNFTSFRFTDANAQFSLNGDTLVFAPLEITGPSAQLRSFGNYKMRTSELEFNTTIFPFRESTMPVMGLIGLMLEPFSRALEVRLTGTFSKPQWSFAAGQELPLYEPVQPPKMDGPGETPEPQTPTPATP
ncbi:MAG TPA: AsmA-like C-terminal region-containing protein [Opitutaceae bacterium]|nr:AsmA-like C-terminal region-containing protein [Opitutaceae bacterium]